MFTLQSFNLKIVEKRFGIRENMWWARTWSNSIPNLVNSFTSATCALNESLESLIQVCPKYTMLSKLLISSLDQTHQTTNSESTFFNEFLQWFFFNWQTADKLLFWTNKKFVFFCYWELYCDIIPKYRPKNSIPGLQKGEKYEN